MGTWIEISFVYTGKSVVDVVPYVGTWIEIARSAVSGLAHEVVPYVGTWIEIEELKKSKPILFKSFPTWERG